MDTAVDRRLNRVEKQLTGIQTLLAALLINQWHVRQFARPKDRADVLRSEDVLREAQRLAEDIQRRL